MMLRDIQRVQSQRGEQRRVILRQPQHPGKAIGGDRRDDDALHAGASDRQASCPVKGGKSKWQ